MPGGQFSQRPRPSRRPYAFRGVLFCGYCERRMQGNSVRTPRTAGSEGNIPALGEPGQVCFVTFAGETFLFEERLGFGQHQGVRAALPPCLMADGQLGVIYPGVDMPAVVFRERPVENTSFRMLEERAEHLA